MLRWVSAVLVASVFLSPFAAHAATPLPKPKPDLATAEPDPEAAISALVEDETRSIGTNVAAYAPTGINPLRPAETGETTLYMVGKLAEDGGPIADGLMWRVFRDFPNAKGQLPLIHKQRGGDLEVRLEPGRYIAHVAYGRAAMSRMIDVRGPTTSETFVLDAGGLQLNAVLDGSQTSLAADTARFEVYTLEDGDRRLIGEVRRGAIARLPAGGYHIVSRYGDVNAVRSADVVVEAGKLTRVSLRHQAGEVRLKLVRDQGGEAIANTEWTVYTSEGEPVFNRVGAHANVTLAAGDYAVVARHRDDEFSKSFTVTSGDVADIVVLAQRFVSPL